MKKLRLIVVAALLMVVAVMPMNVMGAFAKNITYGNELFAYEGMNGYFDATIKDRNISANSFEKIMAGGWDSGAKLSYSLTDSKSYLKLAKFENNGATGKNFSSIATEIKIANIKPTNFIKYTIKFRSRGTSAAPSGLGFALGGGDKRVAQQELTGINSGDLVEQNEWITYVSDPIEVSEADLTPRTAMDVWFNTDGKTAAERYIEIDRISIGRSDTASGAYEENYPYSDFTAYAEAINGRERLTDQPITGGKLGSGNWDSFGVMMYSDANYFLRLAKTTEKGFSGFFSFINWNDSKEGKYKVSMDIKATGEIENLGFRVGGNGVNKEISIVKTIAEYNALPNSTGLTNWKHFEQEFDLTTDDLKADSIQMWNNTQESLLNYMDIDNISIKKKTDADAPVIETSKVEYVKNGEEGDISVGVALNGNEIENIKSGSFVLENPLDYSFANGKITFTKSFLSSLVAGDNEIVINTKKGEDKYQMTFNVYVVLPRPTIPDLSDLIKEETLVGGDFEGKAVDSTLSKDVDANGWGSHNNDYPGKFVDLNGSRVMKIGKTDTTKKDWASCFVMTNPIIQTNDVLKFEFNYKFDTPDKSIYSIVNVCFIGAAASSDMFDINLINLPEKCNKANGKYEWEVTGSELENGWTKVSMTFVADPTWSIKTNSIRFLMKMPENPGANDALYIDNVSLIRYKSADETNDAPVFKETAFTFNKAAQKDVKVSVDLKDFNINKIEVGKVQVPATAYSFTQGADATLIIKKEFLATLENGEHTFSVTTLGGTATFKVTVSNDAAANSGLSTGVIVLICVGGAVVLGGAGFAIYWFIIRKKK